MTDDIERRMNFIVEQQAQFAVDIQRLEESQGRTDAMLRTLVEVSLTLTNHAQASDQRLARLGDETDRRMKELIESQAHTDRRLDALIDVVDKLTRRNGGAR